MPCFHSHRSRGSSWRRLFLGGALAWSAIAGAAQTANPPGSRIDRQALVTRHHPRLTQVDPWAPLSVGSGAFCFTVDVTGLQTLAEHYQKNGVPLETLARWAWHTVPNTAGYKLEDANRPFTAYGRTIGYPTDQGSPAGKWLRENPHDMPLAQIGFVDGSGRALEVAEIGEVRQELMLWTGEIVSRFAWRGEPVEVSTVGDPAASGVAVRVRSRAVAQGKLRVRVAFPRGHDLRIKNNPPVDWSEPQSHRTEIVQWKKAVGGAAETLLLQRSRDDFRYGATLDVRGGSVTEGTGAHTFFVVGRSGAEALEIALWFSPGAPADHGPDWSSTRAAAAKHWPAFWRSGAAVEFSGSQDPRATELERRVVLSQYLMAIQCVADFPPQEGGLTNSTWYGKHHTEMIWWHAAHFALWGRDALLEKNLAWYVGALPVAQALARSRELNGARWAKMIGPDGRESPGGNPLITWNQPHPIHLAELLYRNTPTPALLARYRDLVFETAACMASMLHWDDAKQRFNLGPPMWIAQEIYDPATSMNPPYELSYWIRGLTIAQQWRERLGLGREAEWDRKIAGIAKLPQKDGKYVGIETTPDTWDNKDSRHDHPSFLMAFGQLPGDGVDRAVMARTLDAVLQSWDWETKIWGWDYPMVAMTAARLGEAKKAVDILLFTQGPNNAYAANGHCPQRGDLPVYLPANGALLAAVAMMAGGWEGAPVGNAPGFPQDGSWVVRSEGLRPLP